MIYTTLIDSQQLSAHLDDPAWVVVDCRFSLADTGAGRRAYEEGHIPGAVYAHLDDDLSGPPVTDHGRHPLPTPEAMIALFRRLGIDNESQVVAYDSSSGMVAARLWWMLRYMGHRTAAVLDAGWDAWLAAGLPVATGAEANPAGQFDGRPHTDRLVLIDEVETLPLLIDSREGERFRGETEPLDPVAGHIPGASHYFYALNLDPDGRFQPPDRLRQQLDHLLGDIAPAEATFYCGSGVSACVNLLALAHAGLGDGRLYVGSWSEWSRDPERPKVTM